MEAATLGYLGALAPRLALGLEQVARVLLYLGLEPGEESGLRVEGLRGWGV